MGGEVGLGGGGGGRIGAGGLKHCACSWEIQCMAWQ